MFTYQTPTYQVLVGHEKRFGSAIPGVPNPNPNPNPNPEWRPPRNGGPPEWRAVAMKNGVTSFYVIFYVILLK